MENNIDWGKLGFGYIKPITMFAVIIVMENGAK